MDDLIADDSRDRMRSALASRLEKLVSDFGATQLTRYGAERIAAELLDEGWTRTEVSRG